MNSLKDIIKKIQKVLVAHSAVFIIVFVIGILGLGLVTVILPKITTLRDVGLQGKTVREQTLKSLQGELQGLTVAKNAYDHISTEQLSLLQRALPNEKDVPQLMVDVPALIEKLGLAVSGFDINESTFIPAAGQKDSGTIRRLDISITVNGIETYPQLKAFLAAIEQNLRILDISSISYRPTTQNYSLILTTYYTTVGSASK